MDRLIAVRFRVGDIVVELRRQVTIKGMHDAERAVAVLQTLSDDAHRAHVKKLVERQRLLLHLAPDAVDMFWTTVDLGAHTLFHHLFAQ